MIFSCIILKRHGACDLIQYVMHQSMIIYDSGTCLDLMYCTANSIPAFRDAELAAEFGVRNSCT